MFPITLSDSTAAYQEILQKVFFSTIPLELMGDSANFIAYSIGFANGHTGNMRDHLSDIITNSIPFLKSSKEKCKQHFVFVSDRVHRRHMPEGTHRIRSPNDLIALAASEVNLSGGGGTGVESLMTMVPRAGGTIASYFNPSNR